MIKKFLLATLLCCPLFGNMNILAEEFPQNEVVEENEDLSEEIEMFDSFYQDPERYIFQDVDGNDLNVYVLEHKDDFYQNQYGTTDMLMEKVRSVQDMNSVFAAYAGNSKTWANQKVYYEKTKYVVYTATGTCTVSNGKITSGKCNAVIVNRNGTIYAIVGTTNSIDSSKKNITFTITHSINQKMIKTKHLITV